MIPSAGSGTISPRNKLSGASTIHCNITNVMQLEEIQIHLYNHNNDVRVCARACVRVCARVRESFAYSSLITTYYYKIKPIHLQFCHCFANVFQRQLILLGLHFVHGTMTLIDMLSNAVSLRQPSRTNRCHQCARNDDALAKSCESGDSCPVTQVATAAVLLHPEGMYQSLPFLTGAFGAASLHVRHAILGKLQFLQI